jgi:hypothetical protein
MQRLSHVGDRQSVSHRPSYAIELIGEVYEQRAVDELVDGGEPAS